VAKVDCYVGEEKGGDAACGVIFRSLHALERRRVLDVNSGGLKQRTHIFLQGVSIIHLPAAFEGNNNLRT